jgi:hypothetical protein
VLDVLLSHQALPRKVQLVLAVLDTLVAPSAQHFKTQLAQLAQLPNMQPLQVLVQRAQQLLDHAFLSDLSAAIASSLVPSLESEGSGTLADDGRWQLRETASTSSQEGVRTAYHVEVDSLEQAAKRVLQELRKKATFDERCAYHRH